VTDALFLSAGPAVCVSEIKSAMYAEARVLDLQLIYGLAERCSVNDFTGMFEKFLRIHLINWSNYEFWA